MKGRWKITLAQLHDVKYHKAAIFSVLRASLSWEDGNLSVIIPVCIRLTFGTKYKSNPLFLPVNIHKKPSANSGLIMYGTKHVDES